MKLLILVVFCAIVVISAKTTHKLSTMTEKPICEGVYVNGKLHKRRILMNGINRPYQLAIYNHEHQVFFSYNVGEDTSDTFDIGYVKINYTEPKKVEGIKNGFALAVDEHNKKAYFGGCEGVYEADLTKSSGLKHIIEKRDIWDLFYHNNHLYFIEFPSQHLHKYDINEKKIAKHEHITEKIFQFAIDGDDDIFITTVDGLREIKNGTNSTIHYGEPKVFRSIEVNHKGVAHFGAKHGIYVADKKDHSLTNIASIKNIFGLTFDSDDNIIYSNPHEIVKLLPHDCK